MATFSALYVHVGFVLFIYVVYSQSVAAYVVEILMGTVLIRLKTIYFPRLSRNLIFLKYIIKKNTET